MVVFCWNTFKRTNMYYREDVAGRPKRKLSVKFRPVSLQKTNHESCMLGFWCKTTVSLPLLPSFVFTGNGTNLRCFEDKVQKNCFKTHFRPIRYKALIKPSVEHKNYLRTRKFKNLACGAISCVKGANIKTISRYYTTSFWPSTSLGLVSFNICWDLYILCLWKLIQHSLFQSFLISNIKTGLLACHSGEQFTTSKGEIGTWIGRKNKREMNLCHPIPRFPPISVGRTVFWYMFKILLFIQRSHLQELCAALRLVSSLGYHIVAASHCSSI